MANTNKPTVKTRNTGVMAGIDKDITAPIKLGGTTYTPAELKAVFQAHNTAIDAASALHKQWSDSVQTMDAAAAKADSLFHLLRGALIAQYGPNANAALEAFGMTAPKPRGVKTVKTKAAAVDKTIATRAARHTMGPQQKKLVKGAPAASPSPAVTPTTTSTSGPSPAVPASPATPPAVPAPKPAS